ncbi:hypothetical protein SNEBB_005406 [Seison nebaliae]|nr:hypothetical protein SNEBB_005406 [Seison nebaliae]
MALSHRNLRLAPEVNRILFVKNLPYKLSEEDLYSIFGRFGGIRQIRIGITQGTMGTAYVVYNDIYDAKNACEKLSGFSVGNRYLVVAYYQPQKTQRRIDLKRKEMDMEKIRKTYYTGNASQDKT